MESVRYRRGPSDPGKRASKVTEKGCLIPSDDPLGIRKGPEKKVYGAWEELGQLMPGESAPAYKIPASPFCLRCSESEAEWDKRDIPDPLGSERY